MRIALAALLCASSVAAQELEPRSYSASPIGTSFFVSAYSYSSGGIVFDPTVPVEDAHGYVSALTLAYGHVFRIGGVQALFTAALPYAWGPLIGRVTGSLSDSTVHRTGVG